MQTDIQIVQANLNREEHQQAVLMLVDAYAQDPMGSGKPLSKEVRGALVDRLRAHPTTLILLAYVEDRPIGIAVCFRGFSTFAARPLINIHDLAVLPEFRGCGVGRRLLSAVEARARAMGCCKVTLEVHENNSGARGLYKSVGFQDGGFFFLAKPIYPDVEKK